MLYSKYVVGWQDLVEFVQVRTVTQWQKRRFGRFWFSKAKAGKVGRPTISKELRGLIRQMSEANPLWGTPRIIGELEKLGIEVSRATVDKYRVRVRRNPSPSWKAFLKNEAKAIAGIDFFTVATLNFRVLYVFVVVMHDRRKVIHFNVTEHPSAEWTAQQIVEAFPWETAPKYLLRDNDGIYGREFTKRVKGMGVEVVRTACRSPWQNPYTERLIGSIRRDCLNHVIVIGEEHLRSLLRSYFDYYHRSRTHLGLSGDCPESRKVDPPENGRIVEIPKVGGLHHQYVRKAA